MPPKSEPVCDPPPVCPLTLECGVCCRVVRMMPRLSVNSFRREARDKINAASNIFFTRNRQMKMNPSILVALCNDDTAQVALHNFVCEQRMETPLRFLPVPKVPKLAACVLVPKGQSQESDSLSSECRRQPFNVSGQRFRLLLARSW